MPKNSGSDEDWSEIPNREILVRAASETIGTALLVMVLCMNCLEGWGGGTPTLLQLGLSVGFLVMFIVQIFGHISGGHVNPSITIAALIYGKLCLPMAGIYVLSQIVGAILGYGMLYIITPDVAFANSTAFCTTAPHPEVSVGQAVIVEAIITGILCLLCCSIWDGRNKNNTDAVSIKFGLTITALVVSGGGFTGASMNPARSLAPAIWTNHWQSQWIYWIGPIIGATLFPLFYCIVFKKDAPTKVQIEEEPLREIHGKAAEQSA